MVTLIDPVYLWAIFGIGCCGAVVWLLVPWWVERAEKREREEMRKNVMRRFEL